MKTATLIIFHLHRKDKKIEMSNACKLYRELYGYNNYSFYGKYRSRIDGLIDKINGIRIVRSVVIVRNEDAKSVMDLLLKYQAEIITKKVILDQNDIRQLQID